MKRLGADDVVPSRKPATLFNDRVVLAELRSC